jgi:hypothetical protein
MSPNTAVKGATAIGRALDPDVPEHHAGQAEFGEENRNIVRRRPLHRRRKHRFGIIDELDPFPIRLHRT